jgi:hypothetical protein
MSTLSWPFCTEVTRVKTEWRGVLVERNSQKRKKMEEGDLKEQEGGRILRGGSGR